MVKYTISYYLKKTEMVCMLFINARNLSIADITLGTINYLMDPGSLLHVCASV